MNLVAVYNKKRLRLPDIDIDFERTDPRTFSKKLSELFFLKTDHIGLGGLRGAASLDTAINEAWGGSHSILFSENAPPGLDLKYYSNSKD